MSNQNNLLITFSGADYDVPTGRTVQWCKDHKLLWLVYDDLWLTRQDFYWMNSRLWEHPHKRGFGWYCWKPYIIMCTLDLMGPGDIVMYVDGDTYPVKDFTHLFYQCSGQDDGITLFRANPHKNYQWCKKDCYVVMGQDTHEYHDRNLDAGVARFMLFQKGWWRTTQFLAEWLTYCVNPLATTFDPSMLGQEDEGFVEHRTEQAIMTLLAYKYGIPLHPEADYEQGLFFQDNTRPAETRQTTAEVIGSRWRNV